MSLIKLAIVISVNLVFSVVHAQHIYKIKTDSLLVTNDSCNAELNLENSTRNVLGFLFNKGNGRTEFRKGMIKLNDTAYVIGADTLKFAGNLTSLNAINGLSKTGNTIKLGGDIIENTTINLQNKTLQFNSKDGQGVGNTGRIFFSYIKDTLTNTDNLYIAHQHVGNKINTTDAGSVYLETWWHSPSPVTSGGFANYVSRHKSTIAGTNYSGTTIAGFRSLFEHYSGQTFGKLIHFEASPIWSNSATVNEYYGLFVSALKGPSTQKSYAIYTAGPQDSIFNAGPVRWPRYLNNLSEDSVLTTDNLGRIKLKYFGSGTSGYNTVQEEGAALTQRSAINFGVGLTATDNSGNARTDISVDLNNAETFLASDVTLTANTFSDVVSFSLAPGTWMIAGSITVESPNNTAQRVTYKLWDGTTVYQAGEASSGSMGNTVKGYLSVPISSLIILSSTTTVKVSIASTAASIIKATPGDNNSGTTGKASSIRAIRIK